MDSWTALLWPFNRVESVVLVRYFASEMCERARATPERRRSSYKIILSVLVMLDLDLVLLLVCCYVRSSELNLGHMGPMGSLASYLLVIDA